MPNNIITIYGCDIEENEQFVELSERYGVVPIATVANLDEVTAPLATGCQCISVSSTALVNESILLKLKKFGVEYICTRGICRYIDLNAAKRLGITVENISDSISNVIETTLLNCQNFTRNALA
ncbi:MAG: hypothetical protein LBN08_06090 [Lactobacillales bacterium]|jgi:lactate dehydrogenase-like 2-hydroxyacid dehydrogenase|nr:hypothetical protein [Lactobacillales bacterium]